MPSAPSCTAEQLGSGELLEGLLCRLGLAVRLEQRGRLMGAAPGVVDAYRSAQAAGRELAAEEALRLALGWGLA
jgi:hypothetical protein